MKSCHYLEYSNKTLPSSGKAKVPTVLKSILQTLGK